MKVDQAIRTMLIFVGVGIAGGYLLRTGTVSGIPILSQLVNSTREKSVVSHAWPPVVGQPYPELELMGLSGEIERLADYKGRVLIIEPVAMDCAACQSFTGANDVGPYGSGKAQAGLSDFESYLRRFADVGLDDDRLLYVQLLLYDLGSKEAPSLEDARAWAIHFGLQKKPNTLVLIGTPKFLSQETQRMIPGFHLVDKNFELRCDAGKPPRQDLYRELLPMISKLLREPAAAPETPGNAS